MSQSLVYQIDGANRGGRLHTRLLVEKGKDRLRNIKVVVNDIEPGRAEKLAQYFIEQGIPATLGDGPTSVNPKTGIHNISIDDPSPIPPILESPVQNPVLEIGQLVAPSANGGSIFAIGVVLNAFNEARYRDAWEIFRRLAVLAGERKSSRVMSSPIRHSMQMAPTRERLHDWLTARSIGFIDNRAASAEIRIFDGLSQSSYPVVTAEASSHMKRRDLKAAAMHDLPVSVADGKFAVVFYDRSAAWLFVVLGKQHADRRGLMNTIEIPKIEPVAPRFQISRRFTPPVRQEQRSLWQVLVTD